MMYFWCRSGEDGTSIEALTWPQVDKRLRECARGEYRATFATEIPSNDKGCWIGVPEDLVVIIKGEAVRSCSRPVSSVQGAEITTLEGLAKDGVLHPIQQAWIDEQVPQCGFCQNGQIMTAKALLDRNPNPTDTQIREGMARVLCRCMTYYRVQAAITRAAKGVA